jgi:hypothetical protein
VALHENDFSPIYFVVSQSVSVSMGKPVQIDVGLVMDLFFY